MFDLSKLKLNITKQNSGASASANDWSTTTSAGEIISYNPTTGDAIANVYRATDADYEHIMQAAQRAFLTWRDVPAPKRGEMIRALGDALRQHKNQLGDLVSLETGKSKQEGDGEVQEMIDMADFAVGQARMLYGRSLQSERAQHRMTEQWQPLGVVGVISAFNFPVAVWSWNAFLAAICGDVVIWKPSPKAPLSALAVQHICNQVMQQFNLRGIFSLLISDDNDLVKRMAQDARIALISFTGSTAVGRQIQEWVAARLGKTILELSGNNAVIMDETANLKLAIPAVTFSAIGTAGQRCTTTRRLIVHESIYAEVIKSLMRAYQKVTVGDPLDQKNLMGPLIDAGAVERFVQTVAAAKNQGGEILFGGNVIKRAGFFVEPTLIAAQNDWEVVQRETFAPILYVMKYKNLIDAIAMQNHSLFGLSSSLFTQNVEHAELFLSARGSDCGIANINMGTSGAEIGGAFGGEKATGGGREAGTDAWQHYMRRQTCTINWSGKVALAQGIQFDIS